jgi:hypothetical protein
LVDIASDALPDDVETLKAALLAERTALIAERTARLEMEGARLRCRGDGCAAEAADRQDEA